MGNFSKHALLGLLLAVCIGCSSAPSSICAMSQNRHFWQGIEVTWRGEIIDVMAQPHGGGIYFTDYRCGVNIKLDPDIVPSLYSAEKDWSGHLAVAQFEVSGRLSYKDGDVVLRPERLKRTSPWLTEDAFDSYMEKRRATLVKKDLLTVPPQ